MLCIGNLKLGNRLILAPMSGITNLPFRLIAKRLGAGLVTTEMISAMGLVMKQKKTRTYLKIDPNEKPLTVQLFGSKPEVMAAAAEIAVDAGASIIDLNMGCPAKKVLKTGAGGALLRSPQKIKAVVSAVRRVSPIPLTVKIRTGWSPSQVVANEIAILAQDCGVDAITVHPRFVIQGFSVPADWTIIQQVKEKLNIPVIGNGDILSPAHAQVMRKQTGCDAVMIGRGTVGNPWIFKQILDHEKGLAIHQPILSERKALILEHFRLSLRLEGETKATTKMRGLLLAYTRGLPHSRCFRQTFTGINDSDTLISALDRYFSVLEENET